VRIRVLRFPTESPFGAKGDILLARKMAALPGKSDIAWVGPPFSASGPRSRSAGMVRMMLPFLTFLIPSDPPRKIGHAINVLSFFVANAVLTTDETVSAMR
jgi:hypothetical protein